HPFNSPTYLREYVQPAVNEGLRASGRKREDFTYVTSTFVVVGDTEQELAQHRQSVRQQIAFYASTRTYEPVLAAHGWQDLTPAPRAAMHRSGAAAPPPAATRPAAGARTAGARPARGARAGRGGANSPQRRPAAPKRR